jgi:hypothetical protein
MKKNLMTVTPKQEHFNQINELAQFGPQPGMVSV